MRQRGTKTADPSALFFIDQRTICIEGLVGAAHGNLIWKNGHAEVSEDGAQVNQAAQSSEAAG